MKPKYEIAINTALDILMAYSFYEFVYHQSEGFKNIAFGMVWILLLLTFLSSILPVNKWNKQRNKSTIEKSYHIFTGCSIIGVCFYVGWFITGGFYLASWIFHESRQIEYNEFIQDS